MRTLTRTLAAVGLAAGFVLTAVPAGADQESDAGKAIKRYLEAAFEGEWDTTYGYLPDAQSDLLSESEWSDCQDRRNGRVVGAELEEFDVVKSKKKKRFEIPGTDETATALAVTVEVTGTLDGESLAEKQVVDVVKQGKQWRPSVSEAHIEDCLSGDISSDT